MSSHSLNMTSFQAALKEHYKSDAVENMVYKNNPLLALMKKYTKFGGEGLAVPIISANPAGRSHTFATAQANRQASEIDQFFITRSKDYGVASIDAETMDASQGDSNAFMRAATTEIDGALNAVTRSLAKSLYGDGHGKLAKIGSGQNSTSVTVDPISAITNFEVNMSVVADDASLSAGAGTARKVTAVNRSTGVITLAGALGTNAGDFIFAEGDYIAAGDQLMVRGLEAWAPETVPAAAFFGVLRQKDPTRLGGVALDGSALPIEEALIDGSSLAGREGGRPDTCFMSFASYASLEKALGSKVNYTDVSAKQGVGFKALEIHAPAGTVKVIPDLNCPDDVAWLLQMDTWSLNSLGAAPKLLGSDGNRMLREAAADAVEVRVGYYAQVACKAPGWNCRIKLA